MTNINSTKLKPAIIFFTLLFAFSFFICYFFIAYFNRFASDDYYFLAMIEDKGVLRSVKYFYLNWEGAYSGFFYNFGISSLMSNFKSPFIYNASLCITAFLTLFAFFYVSLKKIFLINDKSVSFLLTIASLSALYYNDLAIAEVWYWMIGGIYLLFPFLFILIFVIFYVTENRFITLLCYISFFLFATVRLNYSVIALCVLCMFELSYYKTYNKINRKSLIAFALITCAIITYIAAPGNYIRHEAFTDKISLNLGDIIKNTFVMFSNYLNEYILKKIHFHLLFMLPIIYIGYVYKASFLSLTKNKKDLFKYFLWLTVALLCLVLAQCFIMYLAKGGQTKRTLPMLNLIFVLYCILIFVYIGALFIKKELAYIAFIVGILGSSALLIRRVETNAPIVINFSEAVDNRINLIEKANKEYGTHPIDTLYVPKLPHSGWLHSGELGKYPDEDLMNNRYLQMYFKTNFAIDLIAK